jgi:AraC-like DNA-binding protein
MIFEFGLRSSLLLIFFTHLLVYAVLCIVRGFRQDNNADKFLGGFLLLSALFILPWMVGYAGWYDTQPYREVLFYTPFVHGLYMGPLLYFYVKSITNFKLSLSRKDLYHFIPGTLYLLWAVIMVVVDKLVIGDYYLMNGQSDPDFDDWYSYSWRVSLLVYLVLSIRYYLQYTRFVPYEVSFAETAKFKWLRNFLYAFVLLAGASTVISVVSLFIDIEYLGSWYYYFVFGLIVYYIAINGYNINKAPLKGLRFEPQLLLDYLNPPPRLLEAPKTEDAVFEVIEDVKQKDEGEAKLLNDWRQKVETLITKEKLYQQPELTLSDVAKKLGTNTSLLSKVINQSFSLNFNDYINRYRVQDVVEKMQDPAYSNQTLLSLAFDAGFNSKSTFNRAFLKFMGMSPKDHFQKLKGSNHN